MPENNEPIDHKCGFRVIQCVRVVAGDVNVNVKQRAELWPSLGNLQQSAPLHNKWQSNEARRIMTGFASGHNTAHAVHFQCIYQTCCICFEFVRCSHRLVCRFVAIFFFFGCTSMIGISSGHRNCCEIFEIAFLRFIIANNFTVIFRSIM